MKAIIANDIKITNPSSDIITYCNDVLTIDNPDYLTAKKVGRYTGNIPKKMKLYVVNGDTYVLPFGTLKDIWKYIKNDYELKISDFKGLSMVGNINLYDYQKNALNAILGGKNGILEAPCGSGKTQIGLQLIKSIGGRALWLTHTKKLLDQSRERCERYFQGDFGEITAGKVHLGRDITFATVQTMSKLDTSIYQNAFDIVVVDECHHCVGTPTKVMQFYKIVSNINCRYKYGLSATLSRGDNMIRSLYAIIGPVLYTIPKEAVGDKIIKAEHIKIPIALEYDMKEYLNIDGTIDFNGLIDMLSIDVRRNHIIVDLVVQNHDAGRKQLLLCHRVKQVEWLTYAIKQYNGIKVNSVTGKVSDKNREYDGDVIIATYALAKEGLDIPSLDMLHLVTPQKNASITEQSVGRIERNIEGKKQPVCYDYVDENIEYCKMCFRQRRRILKK